MSRHKPSPPQDDEDQQASRLASLALDCMRARAEDTELKRAVRRLVQEGADDVLFEAMDRCAEMDIEAFELLRETVEEYSATFVLRREGRPAMEANAFAIPVFVRSQGGLRVAEAFAYDEAYDALGDSIYKSKLESADAKVVLVRHWYTPEQAERIGYGALHAIVREAATALSDKKLRAMPALERSMEGAQDEGFAPDDEALELRFLLGFALKREDDPFYQVPQDAAKADAWFESRMARFRSWTEQAAGIVKRCLAAPGRELELSFLYQDLFHGAYDAGMAELSLLRMLADLHAALAESGVAPADARATIDHDGDMLHITLHGPSGPLASHDTVADLAVVADALAGMGLASVDMG